MDVESRRVVAQLICNLACNPECHPFLLAHAKIDSLCSLLDLEDEPTRLTVLCGTYYQCSLYKQYAIIYVYL